jgi:hypothetical protein
MIDADLALELVLSKGNEWECWRALRLAGDDPGQLPPIPAQGETGAFIGPSGSASPGATGEALCHLVLIDLATSRAARKACDWLESQRTPAMAWLDSPDEVPGELDTLAAARVWATAAAACGLQAMGRDPGPRAIDLLRGEADLDGRFTGGAYVTFAAAGAYWLAEGPKTEMAEWALRWAREAEEEWWGPWEWATALSFWGAAGIPPEHASVELFVDELRVTAPADGWPDDLGLTIRTLELIAALD